MGDITLRLKLDDQVSSKMRNISNTSKSTASQMSSLGKEIDKAFSASAAESFSADAGKAIDSVANEAKNLGNAIDEAFSGSASQVGKFADEMSEVSRQMGRYQDANGRWHEANGRFVKGFGTGQGADDFEKLGDEMERTGSAMDSASSKALNLGSALKTLFVTAGGVAAIGKIKNFGQESVGEYSGLEIGMAEVSTLLPEDANMAAMTSQVREFALETGKLTDEIVPALYQSISASVPAENVFEFLEVANMAAVGGVTELETSVDGITSVINAYGPAVLSAGEASDQMFTAVRLGKTTFGELASSLYNVVPMAVNANVAFGDITAALATITAAGTPTSVASTQMRQMLVELADSGSQVGETFETVAGKGFKQFLEEGNNLGQALSLLEEHAEQSGLTIDQLFSSVEAGQAAAGLTGGRAEVFADAIDEMANSAGATEAAYSKMTDTFQHKSNLLAAAIEDIKIDAGAGLIEGLGPAADTLLENMDEIKEPVVGFFTEIGELIADLAPLLPGALDMMSDAVSVVGDVVGPLAGFMADNPEKIGAGLSAVATGMLAFKGVNALSDFGRKAQGISSFTGAIGKLAPTLIGHPWAAGAAAVTGAIAAIGVAIDDYNDMQINNNLEEHFGDIELTAAQIEDVAGHILDAEYLVNVNAALGEFENAEQLAAEAETALAANDALEWQAGIGMRWDESEVTEYISNIDTFIDSSVESLESKTYAASVTITTMLGGTEEGQTLAAEIQKWSVDDQLEMSALSDQLRSAVEKAMEDGVLSASEQAAITILQNKMNSILAGWKEADAQAELDLIGQKYGGTSGKDLTVETFERVVEELGVQREEAQGALDESYTAVMSTLHGLDNSGRLEEVGLSFDTLEEQAGFAYRNAEASSLMNSVDFERNTLTDTYGDQLNQNFSEIEAGAQKSIDVLGDLFTQYENGMATSETLFSHMKNSVSNANAGDGKGIFGMLVTDKEQAGLSEIYKTMQPDVSAMQSMIEEYRSAGQEIPQALMDSYNETMMLGAASGDANAAWQVFANQMVEDAGGIENALNDSVIAAIQSGTIDAPQELKNALDIALSETTSDPLTMDEVGVSLAGFDLDVSQISELTGMTEEEVTAALEKMGIEAEVDVETTPGEIDPSGAEAAGQAAEDAAQNAAGETLKTETVVEQELVNGGTDTSQIDEAASEAAGNASGEMPPVEYPTDITITAGNIDATQAMTAAQEQVTSMFATAFPADGTVDVTLEKGADNIASVYSQVGDTIRSAWAVPYKAAGTVNVTLTADYSLANPSKTISFSGGATGSATVSAALYADGGRVDKPHLGMVGEAGYPEYIIPMDGSENAAALWQAAGEEMGMYDAPLSISPRDVLQNTSAGAGGVESSSSREINLNINGSGNIGISGGTSKEDVLQILIDNLKDVLMGMLQDEILTEGDGTYEY